MHFFRPFLSSFSLVRSPKTEMHHFWGKCITFAHPFAPPAAPPKDRPSAIEMMYRSPPQKLYKTAKSAHPRAPASQHAHMNASQNGGELSYISTNNNIAAGPQSISCRGAGSSHSSRLSFVPTPNLGCNCPAKTLDKRPKSQYTCSSSLPRPAVGCSPAARQQPFPSHPGTHPMASTSQGGSYLWPNCSAREPEKTAPPAGASPDSHNLPVTQISPKFPSRISPNSPNLSSSLLQALITPSAPRMLPPHAPPCSTHSSPLRGPSGYLRQYWQSRVDAIVLGKKPKKMTKAAKR